MGGVFEKVLKAGATKNFVHPALRFAEDCAQRTGGALTMGNDAGRFIGNTALKGESFFNTVQHLKEADVGGRLGETKTASRTPVGLDEAAFGKGLKNLGEKTFWNAFVFADFIHHDGTAGGLLRQI